MNSKNHKKLILVCSLIIIMAASCRFYFDTTKDQVTATKTATSFERGRNLTFNVCGGCHYVPSANKFIGKKLNSIPKIAGHLYSANLTNSKTNGLPPTYTDAELFYLLKRGIGRDGRFLPFMMRPMMADDDIKDIIVYLRSGDGPVSAADTTVGKSHINLIGKLGMRFDTRPQPYNKDVPRPSEDDPIAYGRYLVAVVGCYHCHSAKMLAIDYLHPEDSKGYMAGGVKLKDPLGRRLRGPNLTPDKETGIGSYTVKDFRTAVRDGINISGKKLSPPMDKFKELTDKQVDAIYAYLQSLPPKHHTIRRG